MEFTLVTVGAGAGSLARGSVARGGEALAHRVLRVLLGLHRVVEAGTWVCFHFKRVKNGLYSVRKLGPRISEGSRTVGAGAWRTHVSACESLLLAQTPGRVLFPIFGRGQVNWPWDVIITLIVNKVGL
jgi:hypothetical protein